MQLPVKIISRLMFFGMAVIAGPALFAQQAPAGDTVKAPVQAKGLMATGIIKDAANGKPLAAINISIPGYSAALTDDNGRFSIKVPDYNATLFIHGEGLQSKEIALKGRSNVVAGLYEETFNSVYDNAQLPFGAKPKNQTVNAIASVNMSDSWYRNTETPDGLLQGKTAGLSPIMRSGTPHVGSWLNL